MIQFDLLGSTELRGHDGQVLLSVLSQPKRLTLFSYLVLSAGDGFARREKLTRLFWPESDAERGRGSLRRSLSFLRKSLGDGVIVTRGDDEVGIAPGAVGCDVARFEAALAEDDLPAALEAYRGPLLDGVHLSEPGVERWLEDERSRLQLLAVRAARSLAEEAEKSAVPDNAVEWSRKACAIDPLSEVAVRGLLRALAAVGDRDAAVRTYDRFREQLAEELELEPSEETRALIDGLRARSETATPVADPAATSTPPADAGPEAWVAAAGTAPPSSPSAATAPARAQLITIATVAVAAVALIGVVLNSGGTSSPGPVIRSSIVMAEGEEMIDQAGRRFALSPDGTRFVYAGGPERRLWIRRRDQLNARPLPGTEGGLSPFFSPEGRQIGFFSGGALHMVPAEGGAPTLLTDEVDPWGGASWGAGDTLYVGTRGFGGLMTVTAEPGTTPRTFTRLDSETGETRHVWPDALPGSNAVIFSADRARAGAIGSDHWVAAADVRTGAHKTLVEGIFARHAGPEHIVYVTLDSTLMVVGFDSETLELTGSPAVLTPGQRVGFRRSVDISVSHTGTLMYAAGTMPAVSELVWVSREGQAEPFDPPWRGDLLFPAVSPDGSRIAVVSRGAETSDVWIGDLRTGARLKLTTEGGVNGYPAWTPDGSGVTYFARKDESADLWTKPADGSGPARLELDRPRDLAASAWSPDGEWLIYRTTNVPQPSLTHSGAPVPGAADILAVPARGEAVPVALATSDRAEFAPSLSPDGRFLAYMSEESDGNEVFVVPFPDADEARWAVAPGGRSPVWSRQTPELFYRNARLAVVSLRVETEGGFTPGRPEVLFEARQYLADGLQPMYAVTPDGQRFLMIRPAPREPGEVIVVDNWFEELPGGGRAR